MKRLAGMRMKTIICTGIISLLLLVCMPVYAAPDSDQGVLKRGVISEDVSKLQTKLREYGYYNDVIDGRFGANTLAAVVQFQLDSGMQPDGVVSGTTWEALKNFRGASSISRGKIDQRKAEMIISLGKQYLGVPYVWAGRSPGGFDCSGFIYYIYNQFGISLPRMADGQFEVGIPVGRQELQPGDLVFFSTYEPGPSHVGIYLGNEQFLHASSGAGYVTITPMANPYHRDRYIGARRVIK